MNLKTTDATLKLPCGDVFVRKWIPENAASTPIILLHDSLGCVELWRDFPPALATATQRTVIAYDRLGFGKSSLCTEPMDISFIDDEARFNLPAVIAALGIGQYILFGHSVGGAMALVAAATQGDNCLAVISESALVFVEDCAVAEIRKAKQGFADESQFEKLARWHGERTRWVLDSWTGIWLSKEFRHWTLDAYLAQIQIPLLAIHGDADEYGSCRSPRHITQCVHGPASMEIIPTCGHFPHRENPDKIVAMVFDFLKENAVS